MNSLYSIDQLSKEDILEILDLAERFEANRNQNILNGKVCATLFFEPSTRTRLSFETAVTRLGGRVIGFSDASNTSSTKGETLSDTIRMVSNYADMIIMRHHLEGAAKYASEVTNIPIINAGDGANQHPSQTLLDLYTIRQTQGTLENLNVTMVGDLKYGRTVHSLISGLSHFNPTFKFVAVDALALPQEYYDYCDEYNIRYEVSTQLTKGETQNTDILYMTRVQKERFLEPEEYEEANASIRLDLDLLEGVRDNLRVLHPLPRVTELPQEVDNTQYAAYFKQAQNGLFVREAIITRAFGLDK